MFAAMAADAEDGRGKEPGLYDAARAIYKGEGKVRSDEERSDELTTLALGTKAIRNLTCVRDTPPA